MNRSHSKKENKILPITTKTRKFEKDIRASLISILKDIEMIVTIGNVANTQITMGKQFSRIMTVDHFLCVDTQIRTTDPQKH